MIRAKRKWSRHCEGGSYIPFHWSGTPLWPLKKPYEGGIATKGNEQILVVPGQRQESWTTCRSVKEDLKLIMGNSNSYLFDLNRFNKVMKGK